MELSLQDMLAHDKFFMRTALIQVTQQVKKIEMIRLDYYEWPFLNRESKSLTLPENLIYSLLKH